MGRLGGLALTNSPGPSGPSIPPDPADMTLDPDHPQPSPDGDRPESAPDAPRHAADGPERDDNVPGGPWSSWTSIYTSLAIWGVVCILFLIWMTATLNIEVGP